MCQAACLVLEGENPRSNLVNISCTLSTYYVLGSFAGRWDVKVNWTSNLILLEPLRLWWSPGKPNISCCISVGGIRKGAKVGLHQDRFTPE